MPTELITEPYFESFVMEDEHPQQRAGFICSNCSRSVDDGPCPEHAPTLVPGLALVECEASPRHWAWVLASDANGYGIPCYACILAEQSAKERAADACRHWPWRRWTLTHWLARKAYAMGITAGGGGLRWGNGCDWCQDSLPGFTLQPRVYILGVPRDTWRCWLIGHHRRGEPVGFGFCGKCVPWSCCGSIREAHVPGCAEDDASEAASNA